MKERMVTRTIKSLKVTSKCYTEIDESIHELETTIPFGNYTEDKVKKLVEKKLSTDTQKVIPLCILGMTENVELFGMSESKFIELAEKLPPREKKAVEPTNKKSKREGKSE